MRVVHRRFPRLYTLPVETQEQLEVPPGSWNRTDGGLLVSEYASEDTLLVAHNTATSAGIVGYFSEAVLPLSAASGPIATTPGRRQIESCLPAVLELGPPGKTSVWLGGAALRDSFGLHKNAGVDRQYLLQRVREHLPSLGSITPDWTPQGHDFVHVRLDAGTGELAVEFATMPQEGTPTPPAAAGA